jgi:hypothetical protein
MTNVRYCTRLRQVSHSFTQDLHGVPQRQYIDAAGKVTPFPASLVIQVCHKILNVNTMLIPLPASVRYLLKGGLAMILYLSG